MKLWWSGDPAIDSTIQERFGQAAVAARAGDLDAWADQPESCLALVLLLDQVPRNVFRGTPEAFASDPKARATTRQAIERGLDVKLEPAHRYFLYMPLMHSEALADHDLALDRFQALIDTATALGSARVGVYQGALDYEHKHREIVARFGRYPHRNEILGRSSTAEELAFLEQPGSSF